jgi:hypothetical protein
LAQVVLTRAPGGARIAVTLALVSWPGFAIWAAIAS